MSETSTATLFIARLFKSGALLADTDGDGLPDSITGLLVLGAAAALPEQRAAVGLAARLGFETLALHLPLASSDPLFGLPEARVPVFIGRPGTVSLQCPPALAGLLEDLAPGEGVVAIVHRPRPTVLVGGADTEGLAAAARTVCSGDHDTTADAAGTHLGSVSDLSFAEIDMIRIAAGQETVGSQNMPSTLEMPRLRSLAELYGPGGFAVDCDGDLLPERPRTAIVLPGDLSSMEAVAVAHLGARLGLETLGLALPLAWSHDDPPPYMAGQVIIAVEPLDSRSTLAADAGEILLLDTDDGRQVVQVRGSGQVGRTAALDALTSLDCWTTDGFPSLGAFEQELRRLCALVDPGAALGAVLPAIEQLADVLQGHSDGDLALEIEVPAEMAVETPAVDRCIERWAEQSFPGQPCTVVVRPAEQKRVINETLRLTWEVDEAWLILREAVLPALAGVPQEAEWFIDIRLSEPEGRRHALHLALVEEIRDTGREVRVDQIRVLPAFHQGRSWLMEEVLPRLLALPVGSMVIRVQRFTPASPSLEPPIRWLQDLFGIDELLAGRLVLPVAAIGFELGDGPHTYEIDVYDPAGETLLLGFFDVVHSERPYLKGAAGWGTVHPSTGCVRLWVADECVVNHPLATDPERVWDYVQDSLLPALEQNMRAVSGGKPSPEHQPFFSELSIEVWLSEDDESLGLRQERSSPLECLHEDLYFTVLDFCSALMGSSQDTPYIPPWMSSDVTNSRSRDARLWTAPGLVVPRIHRRDGGAGEIRVSCTAPASQPVLRWHDGQSEGVQRLLPASDVAFRVIGLEVRGPEQRLVIALDGQDDACERARRIIAGWADLRAAGVPIEGGPSLNWDLRLTGELGEDVLISAPSEPLRPHFGVSTTGQPVHKGRAGTVSDQQRVPWDRVLGLTDIEQSLRALAALPEVHAFQAGRSARGRPSYAVELSVPRKNGWWSRAKLSGWKATLMLNARHHANEPASTSALLRLAELLARDDQWRHLLSRVNVVLMPGENVDGMELYDTLQAEHPTWMHHAARYNAAGLEFAAAYSDPNTPHTEALVLPSLWRQWAPDIFCDNHGFPSHAWDQPFAGGSNPWFSPFWIPQALMYAYLPEVRNPRFPEHGKAADALHTLLVDALAADPEIARWNNGHAERYRTFAQQWLPDRYAANYDRGVLIHRSTYDPDVGDAHLGLTGFPGSFPGVATMSMVTEVADETAQGTYMALCARAHLIADQVLLQYLYDADPAASVRRSRNLQPDGRILLMAVRPRPVLPVGGS